MIRALIDSCEISILVNSENIRLIHELESFSSTRVRHQRHSMTFRGIPSLILNFSLIKNIYKSIKHINESDYDFIIAVPGSTGAAAMPAIINLFLRKKMFCYLPLVNKSSIFNPSLLNGLRDRLYIFLLSFFKKIIVVSDDEKMLLSNRISSNKLQVVKNYFNRESGNIWRVNKKLDIYRFCIVSRLDDSQKDISTFLKEICGMKLFDSRNYVVDIFGEGGDLEFYKNLVEKYALENIVVFKGYSKVTSSLLSEYDCMIITSKYESGPLTLLEAINAFLPCISTKVGYSQQILPNECLYEFGHNQMQNALNYAIQNKDLVLEFASGNLYKVVCEDEIKFKDDWFKALNLPCN